MKSRAEMLYNQTKERLPEVTSINDAATAALALVQRMCWLFMLPLSILICTEMR